jgi:hypothetical protein
VLVKGLHEAGWMVECPKASMYVWAKIPEQYAAMGSLEFAKKLLQDAKVCVSPGIGFGDYGDTHVRFALIETAIVSARRCAASNRCSVPTGCCPRASQPAKASNNGAKESNKKREPLAPFLTPLLDHQGKSTGPNDDHKRNAHKKYFTTHHSAFSARRLK